MPVQFLSNEPRARFGRYVGNPNPDQLARFFRLNDADQAVIREKRGDHNRLGFALLLTTARFLGTFLENPLDVPDAVLQTLAHQRHVSTTDDLPLYQESKQRWEHAAEIRSLYSFCDWTEPIIGFRLGR